MGNQALSFLWKFPGQELWEPEPCATLSLVIGVRFVPRLVLEPRVAPLTPHLSNYKLY